jgi:DNA replication protein DnaC
MLIEQTVKKMRSIRLSAMASSFESRIESGEYRELSPDEFVGLILEDEIAERKSRKFQRMINKANLKPEQASLDNIRCSPKRNLLKKDINEFFTESWISRAQNIIITGATGTGKTYLAEALIFQACKMGHVGQKKVFSILLEEIKVARAMGTWLKYLKSLDKVKVLVIDDFLISKPKSKESEELLTVLEERVSKHPTIITSQYPKEVWYERIGEPTLADAICDRLIINSIHIDLKGETQRKKMKNP